MLSSSYTVLPKNEHDWEQSRHVDGGTWDRKGALLTVAFLSSLAINLFALYQWIFPSSLPMQPDRTPFAGLTWDVPSVINYTSALNDPDREVEDAAWRSNVAFPASLTVALDDSYAEAQGLLHSMRWPWDDNKGVYVLAAGHQMHCVHTLRHSVNDAFDGKPSRWARPHLMHCLELLMQTVMCHADDTPLYTGLIHAAANTNHTAAGDGTPLVCRDWRKLQIWANERSACYDPDYGARDPNVTEIDRYRFCPDGSKPWEESETNASLGEA